MLDAYVWHRLEIREADLGVDGQLLPICAPTSAEQLIVRVEERQFGPCARVELAWRLPCIAVVVVFESHLQLDDECEAAVCRALWYWLLGRH